MNKNQFFIAILAVLFSFSFSVSAQGNSENDIEADSSYQFEVIYDVEASPVKSQDNTGTCWSFATISFLESEVLREKGKEYDLSEMFISREAYPDKAMNYVRLHGNANYGQGGQAHDVINAIRKSGIVPEDIYDGKMIGDKKHNHSEMSVVLKGMLDGVVKNRGRKLSPKWFEAYNSVLDIYLGQVPETFEYGGETYSPQSFQEELGINPDDYVEITSFNHHPFYEKFSLEIPDNWSFDDYYNLPLDEMIEVMEYSLENGYSIVWDGDVSDKQFSHKNGVAIVPLTDFAEMSDEQKEKNLKEPEPQKEITQEMRQLAFDNYSSTDDHLMHITGMVKDQNGAKYYITKNSWGEESNDFGGYLNMSEPYIKLRTTAILVNKRGIPKNVIRKLGIK
ncbi:MAG: aminopeptidase [Bacteroidales bacterium]|nr:aminopeptidase [Bacteroidales bacterium]